MFSNQDASIDRKGARIGDRNVSKQSDLNVTSLIAPEYGDCFNGAVEIDRVQRKNR